MEQHLKKHEENALPQPSFLNKFWPNSKKWNGQHTLLTTTDSPSISTSTTVTNLESMDNILQTFGSVGSAKKLGTTKDQNLRVAQPEIEPLHTNRKPEDVVSVSLPSLYNPTTITKKKKYTISQIVTAISVSLVSLVIGFVTAYTAPAEQGLRQDLRITEDQYSWLSGFMPLVALVGALIGGQLIEYFGRRTTIALTDVLFVVSWILTAYATNVNFMYAARAIVGFSVGIASLTLPVYLGETIQPEVRGILGLLPTAFGNGGIVLCFSAGSYLTWNELAYLGIILPIPFLLLMFFIPETPRWYVSKNKADNAKKALQWLRGKQTNIDDEFNELTKSHRESERQRTNSNLKDFFQKAHIKPLFIALGLMVFQQLTGINAVIFYTTKIFLLAGSSIPPHLCTIIVGIVNFVSTFIATVLIDKLGRKVLLYISAVSMGITLAILGAYFYLLHIEYDTEGMGWIPLMSFVVYVLGFSLGFGPVPWLMVGEILPSKIRGSAASLATAVNWSCTFLVTKTFADIISLIGLYGTFWFFGTVCFTSIVFVIFCVPETQGKSLEDIERRFVRRMSSIANLKTTPSSIA
ncbi:Sugar transporter [Popillia japonica]|uniref:Sugar transporter n=1 Tax=Popillia japonica TaxID=7064 RepID=A0AAW1JBF5_POPJA